MFEKPSAVEIYDLVDALHSCIHAPGKPVSEHVLEMKGLMDQLLTLGKLYDNDMAVNLMNRSLNKDFGDFENPNNDQACHYCHVVGHWKRNYPLYLEELRANKKKSEPSAAVLAIQSNLKLVLWEECLCFKARCCCMPRSIKAHEKTTYILRNHKKHQDDNLATETEEAKKIKKNVEEALSAKDNPLQ
nr:zinc finger, CCHC-type [Tanacetum cinerariifolium]